MHKKILNLLLNLGIPQNITPNPSSTVICSTPSGVVPMPPEVKKKLRQLEAGLCSGYKVYYTIISHMHGCDIVDFLLCPSDSSEYEYISDGAKNGFPLSFCWNRTIPFFSEPGSIEVKYDKNIGALIRTA